MHILGNGAMQTKPKRKRRKLIKTMRKFSLEETNTIHPPKKGNKEKLATWASGDGEINKQLDYITISKT